MQPTGAITAPVVGSWGDPAWTAKVPKRALSDAEIWPLSLMAGEEWAVILLDSLAI